MHVQSIKQTCESGNQMSGWGAFSLSATKGLRLESKKGNEIGNMETSVIKLGKIHLDTER